MKKFEDIFYVERIDKYGNTLGLYMPGGFFVFKSTIKKAWVSIHGNWNNIDWRYVINAKDIVGIENWGAPADTGFNRALGRCVKFFVVHNMLPLQLEVARKRNGEPYKGGSVKYVLRGGNTKAAPAISTRRATKVGATSARNIRITPPSATPIVTPTYSRKIAMPAIQTRYGCTSISSAVSIIPSTKEAEK